VPGWYSKHPNEPMCLYGLDTLASRPDAPVLVQEGEKKTDDCQAKLGSGWVCMAWSGGANFVPKHDWFKLARRNVYVSGDAVDGQAAMEQVASLLQGVAATIWTVDTSGFPKGWDLGNAATGEMWKKGELVWKSETGPWTAEEMEAFIHDKACLYDPDPGNVDLEQPEDDDAEWKDDSESDSKEGILPLGQDDNSLFWYLSLAGGRVSCLSAAQHTDMQLIGLANKQWWRTFPQFQKGDCDVDWKEAANFFMDIGRRMPPYNPDKLRGVGAWIDRHIETGEERCVLHQGENLVVDGIAQTGRRLPGSRYIYERRLSINQTIAPPINNVEARKLADIIKAMPWEKPIFGTLMAGWLAVAPICGALKWRPAIWVTGGSGAGKTTLDTNIVAPILDGISLRLQSISTEAGIRQTLKNNAISVIFDEAEAEGLTDKQRMQLILHLVRASTSEGGASIVKGTQSQMGARVYNMRSCFMFMSINVAMNNKADESRITVLALESPPPGDVIVQAR
jgi:putative DNA primase/helicase